MQEGQGYKMFPNAIIFSRSVAGNVATFNFGFCSLQAVLEEGAQLQHCLQGALGHRLFLVDCLKPDQAEKLERDSLQSLDDAKKHSASLTQCLKVILLMLNIATID